MVFHNVCVLFLQITIHLNVVMDPILAGLILLNSYFVKIFYVSSAFFFTVKIYFLILV